MCQAKQKKGIGLLASEALHGWSGEPQNNLQIYRPINYTAQVIYSNAWDIAERIFKNHFLAITFDWSVLET